MYWHAILHEVTQRCAYGTGATFADIRDGFRSHVRAPSLNSGGFAASRRRETLAQKYPLNGKYKGVYFTRREAECMDQFLRGRTIEQTAVTLNIATRTCEYYLLNMKNKLGCNSKAELIGIIAGTNFVKLVDF